MARRTCERLIGGIVGILVFVTGCAESPSMLKIQRALGRDIAVHRASADETRCPTITTFNVSPLTAQCGDPVSLEIAAIAPNVERLSYTWEIGGQSFETGQQAVWNTPTCKTIGDPQKVYAVRGVVSDGECAVTRSVAVKVLCNCAFDAMVHFDFGKAQLDSTAKTRLNELAQKLQQSPDYMVLIEGHTDYVGSNQMNQRLGKKRAEAAKQYLIATWKIDPDRLITRSFGEEKPIASNETPIGRAQNRRAEVFRVVLTTK